MNFRILCSTLFCVSTLACFSSVRADNVFEGNVNTLWNEAGNWDNGVVPPDNENVNIYDSFTVDLYAAGASTGTAHLRVGNSELGETATLNIHPGATLDVDTVNNSNDIILGREDLAQSGSAGFINQLGGVVTVGDYLKMSSDKDLAAGSHYRISGGELYVLDQLQLGRDGGTTTQILFEVIGSGPSVIEINDIKVEQNLSAQATFHFEIDAAGVTPITVLDELQLGNDETATPGVGDVLLEISLSDVPPATDITLFDAGRITMDEMFAGLPDGSTVSADWAGATYSWTLNYVSGATDRVVLSDLVIVPEPTTCALALVGVCLMGRRRSC